MWLLAGFVGHLPGMGWSKGVGRGLPGGAGACNSPFVPFAAESGEKRRICPSRKKGLNRPKSPWRLDGSKGVGRGLPGGAGACNSPFVPFAAESGEKRRICPSRKKGLESPEIALAFGWQQGCGLGPSGGHRRPHFPFRPFCGEKRRITANMSFPGKGTKSPQIALAFGWPGCGAGPFGGHRRPQVPFCPFCGGKRRKAANMSFPEKGTEIAQNRPYVWMAG